MEKLLKQLKKQYEEVHNAILRREQHYNNKNTRQQVNYSGFKYEVKTIMLVNCKAYLRDVIDQLEYYINY